MSLDIPPIGQQPDCRQDKPDVSWRHPGKVSHPVWGGDSQIDPSVGRGGWISGSNPGAPISSLLHILTEGEGMKRVKMCGF
jgi:hypothetical protein